MKEKRQRKGERENESESERERKKERVRESESEREKERESERVRKETASSKKIKNCQKLFVHKNGTVFTFLPARVVFLLSLCIVRKMATPTPTMTTLSTPTSIFFLLKKHRRHDFFSN